MRNTSTVLRIVVVLGAMLLLAAAPARVTSVFVPSATAAVGDCTPSPSWGTSRSDFASQVLTLVNQHRQSLGLNPLQSSTSLTNAATWKALHMAGYGYMAHDDPAPPVARTVGQRLEACGYPVNSAGWGENIAYGYTTPASVMNGWLNSPGHRANIENASYRVIGVGAASSANGILYWAQDFGTVVDSGSGGGGGGSTGSAPTVALTSSPPTSTTSTSASFSWATGGTATTTTCSLDGGTATGCSSPMSYGGLGVGTHTFRVTVANAYGSSADSFSWAVTAPQPVGDYPRVSITNAPADGTTSSDASFTWATTGGTPTRTTCALDGAAATQCSTPTSYSGLSVGYHSFKVTVSNQYGWWYQNYAWNIVEAPTPPSPPSSGGQVPTVTISSFTATNRDATFAWTTTGSPTLVTCSLDFGPAQPCTSPGTYRVTFAGYHVFAVNVSSPSGSATTTQWWYAY